MRYFYFPSAALLRLRRLPPVTDPGLAGGRVQADGRPPPESPAAPVNPNHAQRSVATAPPGAGQLYLLCASDS